MMGKLYLGYLGRLWNGKAWRVGILAGILGLACLAGCSSDFKGYVRADRMTFEAVAPHYREYLDTRDPLTRDSGKALLDSWKARLEQAEEK